MVKKIVLSVAAILFACTSVFAQNKQVSGTVTGPDGSPIVGATVVVEGTTLGTSTDMQGKYMLAAPANGTLVFSFIGYDDTKIAINGKTAVNAVLKEASKSIDEVIVVAFGEAKKDAFTGSAKVVSADDLAKTQSSNVSDHTSIFNFAARALPVAVPEICCSRFARQISTAATPFCSLHPPQAAVANVPKLSHTSI